MLKKKGVEVSKLHLKRFNTDPAPPDADAGELLALYEKSKADVVQLREQCARMEANYLRLEQSRSEDTARVDA